ELGRVARGGAKEHLRLIDRERWNVLEHEIFRPVFEDARRLAALVANDRATRWIRRVLRDAGDLERARVRKRHVPVEARNEDRVVGNVTIDEGPRGKLRAGPV